MIKRIDWRTAFWGRRSRETSPQAAAPVLSRERVRELEHPTYLRRNLCIAGLDDARRSH
jgi:hypothetical protein